MKSLAFLTRFNFLIRGVCLMGGAAVSSAQGAPPAHDAFAARSDLGMAADLSVTADNTGATAEAGEPAHAGQSAAASLWWKWTAPSSGLVNIDTFSSSVDTLLAVYTGESLGNLTMKVFNDDAESGVRQSWVTFEAVEGVTYSIAADTYAGTFGGITLNLVLGGEPERPANDAFDFAEDLGLAASVLVERSSQFATPEPGEPARADSPAAASVWWRWTAPAAGTVSLSTAGSGFDTLLAVYTGLTLDTLTQVAVNDDAPGAGAPQSALTFLPEPGETYYIAVDGYGGSAGLVRLSLSLASTAPLNDAFANAVDLGSEAELTAFGANLSATAEPSEPMNAGASARSSIWWRWTAPVSGEVEISTEESNFDTRLAVFSGDNLNALQSIASNDDADIDVPTSKVRFTAVAGTAYSIAVDEAEGGQGVVFLHIRPAPPLPPPANDSFAARANLGSGDAVAVTATNLNATAESGEPAHAGQPGQSSVWWRWTASAGGLATISTEGSTINTRLAVYTGTAPQSLTLVRANDDASPVSGFSLVRFRVNAGVSYAIAVDGFDGAQGAIRLSLTRGAEGEVGSNDLFSAAIQIPGELPQTVTGSNTGATVEPDEPAHADSPASGSVWWTWTASRDGWTEVSTAGSDFDTRVAIYTGETLGALTPVAAGDDYFNSPQGRARFVAVKGTVYQIAVDGFAAGEGSVRLSLTEGAPPPANDHFADRLPLSSQTSTVVQGTTLNASAEEKEPEHGGTAAAASVWWQWTAPSAGRFVIRRPDASSSGFVAVYTGDALDALVSVASGTLAAGASFDARAGDIFQIAADVAAGEAPGPVRFAITTTTVPRPANDSFAGAADFGSGENVRGDGTNAGATAEAGEPDRAGQRATASVWWKWTAPASGYVTVDTAESGIDTVLGVYTGTAAGTLSEIAVNDDANAVTAWSRVEFTASAGTVYYFAVDGFEGQRGLVRLNLTLGSGPQPPINDSFARAADLGNSEHASFTGTSAYATAEEGEPAHAGNPATASIWFKWTAPHTIPIHLTTEGSAVDTVLAVYTGESPGALTLLVSNDDMNGSAVQSAVSFNAVAGTVYYVAVDGYTGSQGVIQLNLTTGSPANDHFADRAPLGGGSEISITGSSTGATVEPGEPRHAGQDPSATVWWTWTAPDAAVMEISTLGSSFDTVLAVYTGSTLGGLTLIAANNDADGGTGSHVSFSAAAGVAYHIAVGSAENAGSGSIALRLRELISQNRPANDQFDSAEDLGSAVSVDVTGTNIASSAESHEPAHADRPAHSSVWWKWTAPAAGKLNVNTLASTIDTVLAVYRGDSPKALIPAAFNDDAGPGLIQSRASVFVTKGTVYHIAVDGFGGAEGAVALSLRFESGGDAKALYTDWMAARFPAGTSAAVRGVAADFDGDGQANGLEFLTGEDPATYSGPVLTVSREAGATVLTYPRHRDAPDGLEIIEASADLVSWTALTPQQFTRLLTDRGTSLPDISKAVIPDSAGLRFFRLKLVLSP